MLLAQQVWALRVQPASVLRALLALRVPVLPAQLEPLERLALV